MESKIKSNMALTIPPLNVLDVLVASLIATLVYILASDIYNVYFHPLAHIPGPWQSACSRLFYIRALFSGKTVDYIQNLHAKYGDVVRYSPNEISFISGETAWQDIYGFRIGKSKDTGSFEKDPAWTPPSIDNLPNMLGAVGNNHGRHRKILAHAFSTSALKGQEGLLTQYADMLVDCLREETNKLDSTVDISQYLMWTTFDIIADLCFGEPYGCLADPTADHPYAEMVMSAIAGGRFHYIQVHWPWVKTVGLFYDKVAVEKRQEYHRWVKKQTYKRMAAETKRPDFTALILAHRDNHGEDQSISDAEMCSNNSLMLAAGTETTATAMTVAFFLLLNNPDKMAKAVEEVRSRFESTQDITVDAANQLSYLIACMNETLRCVPPVPLGFPRRVPESGGEISGHFIPGNCKAAVSVSQYVAYHSERNFKNADCFKPERWLGDEEYADDNRAVFQPFSFGPRNCIGKNLAYAEMRLIMAKLLFEFDFELDERSRRWDKGLRVLGLWDKPRLFVKVQRAGGATAS